MRWPLPVRMVSRSDSASPVEVERLEPPLDRLGAHRALEVLAEAELHLAVEDLVAHQVLDLEGAEGAPHFVDAVELALRPVADLLELALGAFLGLALDVGLRALGLESGEVFLELAHASLDVGVATLLELLALDVDLGLERGAGPCDGRRRRPR